MTELTAAEHDIIAKEGVRLAAAMALARDDSDAMTAAFAETQERIPDLAYYTALAGFAITVLAAEILPASIRAASNSSTVSAALDAHCRALIAGIDFTVAQAATEGDAR